MERPTEPNKARTKLERPVFSGLSRRRFLISSGLIATSAHCWPTFASEPNDIDPEAYFQQVQHTLDVLAERGGAPLAPVDVQQIAALAGRNDHEAIALAEDVLERYTLANVFLESEWAGRASSGGAERVLTEQGWQVFLVRFVNGARRKMTLSLSTGPTPFPEGPGRVRPFPSAGWDDFGKRDPLLDVDQAAALVKDMWLLSEMYETTTVTRGGVDIPTVQLSGLPIEYRVIELFSRDAGRQHAELSSYVLPDRAPLPKHLARVALEFECRDARTVTLGVRDTDGRGCTAALTIRDKAGRLYPPPLMRVVPDRFAHEQIYRSDGERIRLPDGDYIVESMRGPEYVPVDQPFAIRPHQTRMEIHLERWIDVADWGWYSGDTHMHANCCIPYNLPVEGDSPETMIREVRGEGLAISEVLVYGIGWPYQSQFFHVRAESPLATLEQPKLQAAVHTSLQPHSTAEDPETTLHYGIETSGFPSLACGHLVLLRLKELQYPGTAKVEDWPSWNLPILRWAKSQGAVAGYGHCGLNLEVASTDLPNYDIPAFSGIGANEAIIDVALGLVDFLGGCDADPVVELNLWYHLLNCGYRMAFLGESDYPGLTAHRPGMGRSYVRLEDRPIGDAGYNSWMNAMSRGRLYCGEGRSHFLDFKVNGRRNGEDDLTFDAVPDRLKIEALVAARLEPEPVEPDNADTEPYHNLNGWHLEKARIGRTRNVAVELVINGVAIDKAVLLADGVPRPVEFAATIPRSSWVALRILPSAHTHPVFVHVDGKPIRASKRSATWCRDCVDKIWKTTAHTMRDGDRQAASAAFARARRIYESIISECEVA